MKFTIIKKKLITIKIIYIGSEELKLNDFSKTSDETKSPDAGQKDEGEELDGSKKDSDQQSEKVYIFILF